MQTYRELYIAAASTVNLYYTQKRHITKRLTLHNSTKGGDKQFFAFAVDMITIKRCLEQQKSFQLATNFLTS